MVLREFNIQLRAYVQLLRLHRPAAFTLVIVPSLWALLASAQQLPDWQTVLIFALGGATMRSAGCIINDIFDRDIDKRVERTKNRPLACGDLSLTQALVALALLLALALALLLQLSVAAQITALLGFPLIVLYPLTKRFVKVPQLFMGLAFALGVPIAYAHNTGGVPVAGWAMYAMAALWMLNFDLQYALQDIEDDREAGINSGALLLGERAPQVIAALHLAQVLAWCAWALALGYAAPFYAAMLLVALCFAYQYRLLRAGRYYQAFANNQWVAWLILLALSTSIW